MSAPAGVDRAADVVEHAWDAACFAALFELAEHDAELMREVERRLAFGEIAPRHARPS